MDASVSLELVTFKDIADTAIITCMSCRSEYNILLYIIIKYATKLPLVTTVFYLIPVVWSVPYSTHMRFTSISISSPNAAFTVLV